MSDRPARPTRPGFRPHFTLFLLYFAVFFLGFALLLILPEMLSGLESLPPGVDAEKAGTELAQEIAAPRLLAAFLLASVSLGLGSYYQVLPGIKSGP